MKNSVAKTLQVVSALLFIIVFVAGIYVGNVYSNEVQTMDIQGVSVFDSQFNTLLMLEVWIAGSLPAFLFLGIAEIIKKLHSLCMRFEDKQQLAADENKIRVQFKD